MARYPVPGRVKRRLAASLGAERACDLYRAFVLDLADRIGAWPFPVVWAYEPDDAPFAELLPGVRCRPQRGPDLGARMEAAIADELADGAGAAIVLGADVPHVDRGAVEMAAAVLAGGADVALGPAEDGGYYLIGVRARQPGLFTGLEWGRSDVAAVTCARARKLGLGVSLLPVGFDVDQASDLDALARLIAAGKVFLPRTTALLGRV